MFTHRCVLYQACSANSWIKHSRNKIFNQQQLDFHDWVYKWLILEDHCFTDCWSVFGYLDTNHYFRHCWSPGGKTKIYADSSNSHVCKRGVRNLSRQRENTKKWSLISTDETMGNESCHVWASQLIQGSVTSAWDLAPSLNTCSTGEPASDPQQITRTSAPQAQTRAQASRVPPPLVFCLTTAHLLTVASSSSRLQKLWYNSSTYSSIVLPTSVII